MIEIKDNDHFHRILDTIEKLAEELRGDPIEILKDISRHFSFTDLENLLSYLRNGN